jgi:hypothetical protein
VLAALLVGHPVSLCCPLESILIEELAAFQLRSELIQRRPKRCQFQTLHVLDERPELGCMERHAAPHFVGHGPVVVATLIEEQQPAHDAASPRISIRLGISVSEADRVIFGTTGLHSEGREPSMADMITPVGLPGRTPRRARVFGGTSTVRELRYDYDAAANSTARQRRR